MSHEAIVGVEYIPLSIKLEHLNLDGVENIYEFMMGGSRAMESS